MPEYRVYIIGSDGHFVNSVELDCADDSELTFIDVACADQYVPRKDDDEINARPPTISRAGSSL
jgi:hypothetical protein